MENQIPILEYHDLTDKPVRIKSVHSPYVLSTTKFYRQMKWLQENGYDALTIDDLLSHNVSARSVALTFDDGHVSNYKLAFPILEEFRFIATFFIVPNCIDKKDYLTREQILEMHEQGMRFESHSLTHPYMLLLSREKKIKELYQSKEEIQNLLGSVTKHFSVPYGFYDEDLIQCVRETGYKSLVTENIGYYTYQKKPFHILPRFTIKSNIDFDVFKDIVKIRKSRLAFAYIKEFILNTMKKTFGYKRYIHLKSLVLKKEIEPFRNSSD